MVVSHDNPFRKKTPVGIHAGGMGALAKRIDNLILIGVPALGTLVTPFWIAENGISWIEISAFFIFYIFSGIGVGVGLHRYFSHKSFEPHPVIKFLLGAGGQMACQGSILRWVIDHRRHHAHTDINGDTHSPYISDKGKDMPRWRGLAHAHIGWMFDGTVTDVEIYGKDLTRDRMIMFFHKTHWLWPALTLALPFAYGYLLGGMGAAIGCLLIAGLFRVFLFQNVVWAVNSVAHTFGYQTYADAGGSRNHYLLAMLTFGDGWHNNHHRFPRSCFHGLDKSELDLNGKFIVLLERVGLASKLIRIPQSKLLPVPTTPTPAGLPQAAQSKDDQERDAA